VLIVACGFLLPVNTGIASGSSIYPAIQNLMLAARALGLGTALTTLHRHNEGAVRELLGIPENAHVAAVIPVGWPKGKFGAGPRKPVEEVTYWDHWGERQ
jgi:nitroreductase